MLGDFLLNTGVLGLLKTFRYAENYGDGCREEIDYQMEGQSLFISRDYLQTHDLAELYIQALVHYLGKDTKFQRVMQEGKSRLDSLYQEMQPDDKNWKKKVDEGYREFTDMLLKNSFQSGYKIIAGMEDGTQPIPVEAIKKLKAEKDYAAKKEQYDALYELLCQPQVQKILKFKDILYSCVNLFYADNQGSGAAFLSKREIDPAAAFREKFIQPVEDEWGTEEKKRKDTCIICGGSMKKGAPISIFVDTADDLGKKKSYYWNGKPDAYLCPLCALVCAFSPLGFTYEGNDAIFINNNSDIKTLLAFDSTLNEERAADDPAQKPWFRLYNTFTSNKLKGLENRISHIQVIVREKDTARYRLNTVDRSMLALLKEHEDDLDALKNIIIKCGQKDGRPIFVNVYQEVLDNIVNRRSQYRLLTNLLHWILQFEENKRSRFLFRLLKVEIARKGGDSVEKNIGRAYVAREKGKEMREFMASESKLTDEKDKDNKLRGLVYQLLNAVSLGNRDKFMELILRTYAGHGKAVPDIFFSCFGGDEDFKQIGYAYLLGLKGEKEQPANDKETKTDAEAAE